MGRRGMPTEQGTRAQILAAAEGVILERGLGAATTRAIAEPARCAEGSIYRHFPDKHALFLELVRTRFPAFLDLMASLPDEAGQGNVTKHLETVAAGALEFYRGIVPLVAGMLADEKLLEQQRRQFGETNSGPMKIFASLATFLRREQRMGRVAPRPSPEHVSRLLLGACYTQAILERLLGEDLRPARDEHFARECVRALTEGLQPSEAGVLAPG